MKRIPLSRLVGLAALVVLPAGLSPAQLATNAITLTLPDSPTDWTNNFVLPQINLPAERLFGVEIEAQITLNTSGFLNNVGSSTAGFSFQEGSMLTVALPGGSLQPQALAPLFNGSVSAFSSVAYGPFNGVIGSASTFLQGSSLTPFIGSSTLNIMAFTATGGTVTGGNGNVLADLTTTASATLITDYVYYAVPEPSAGVLLIAGFGVLACARRWRRPAASARHSRS